MKLRNVDEIRNFEITISVNGSLPESYVFAHDTVARKAMSEYDRNDVCRATIHTLNKFLGSELENEYTGEPYGVYDDVNFGDVRTAEQRARWAAWRIDQNQYDRYDPRDGMTRRKDQGLLRRLEKRIMAETTPRIDKIIG